MTIDQFLIKAYQQHLIMLAKDQVSDEELEYISTLYSGDDDYFDEQECLMFAEDEPSLIPLTFNTKLLRLICQINKPDKITNEQYKAMKIIKLQHPENEFVGFWWVFFSAFWLGKNNTPQSEMEKHLNGFLESHPYLKEIEDFI
jgi:hypothetical protein